MLVTEAELASVLGWPDGADTTELTSIVAAADSVVTRLLDPAKGPHDAHDNDRQAALAVAVQIHASRQSPGGQMQAVDYQPIMVPHLLGPGLLARVQGLLAPCREYGGLVVG
jgi:hypothetical protein